MFFNLYSGFKNLPIDVVSFKYKVFSKQKSVLIKNDDMF